MLNKKEKQLIDEIITSFKKFDDIFFHHNDLYKEELEFDNMPESEYNKKVFPYYKVMSDMWDIVNGADTIIKNIQRGEHVRKYTLKQKFAWDDKMRNKRRQEEKELEDIAYKQGVDMAVTRYEWHKHKSLGSELKKERKIQSKAYKEGKEHGKELEHLTDEQIIRKAKQFELEKKIGFRD